MAKRERTWKRSVPASGLVLLCLTSLVIGCGRSEPSVADVNNTNIKRLRGAYGMFLIAHGLKGPQSEEELKEFLRTDKGALTKLERMGLAVDDIDAIFVSERDGKPFKVRYGLEGIGDHPMVFESEGVDGRRLIAFVVPREVDDAEYEALWNAKIDSSSGMETMNEAVAPAN